LSWSAALAKEGMAGSSAATTAVEINARFMTVLLND
jgi:hypothetical protein